MWWPAVCLDLRRPGWHKILMTILKIRKLMTHTYKGGFRRIRLNIRTGLSFCDRKWKQKIILTSWCRHQSCNPLTLWDSLQIPDTILAALLFRIMSGHWQSHQPCETFYQKFWAKNASSWFCREMICLLPACCLSSDYWQLLDINQPALLAPDPGIVL